MTDTHTETKRAGANAAHSVGPSCSDVTAFVREMTDSPRASAWAVSFHAHWNGRKPPWTRGGKPIDWKETLSRQVRHWEREEQAK